MLSPLNLENKQLPRGTQAPRHSSKMPGGAVSPDKYLHAPATSSITSIEAGPIPSLSRSSKSVDVQLPSVASRVV
jgi:hypothetical protein